VVLVLDPWLLEVYEETVMEWSKGSSQVHQSLALCAPQDLAMTDAVK